MHVVTMTVADITNDTRVKRQALALARGGYETTVLSRSSSEARQVLPLGDAVVIAVPLRDEVTAMVRSVRARRRAWRPLPAWMADEQAREVLARRRHARRQADEIRAQRSSRVGRHLRRVAARAARRGTTAAGWLDERIARGWSAFDERLSSSTAGASWRRSLDGLVDDLELTMGPLLDALAPDAIHAHDMHVLTVAVHAARRAAAAGRDVKVVYDAHEYVPGLAVAGSYTPRTIAAWADLEAEYAPLADRVIAVSPGSAEAIQRRLALPRPPDVVLNVPVVDPDAAPRPLRVLCGLTDDVPLAVYSGGIREVRGIDTSIAALRHLPGVHLAVVCVPHSRSRPVVRLAELARREGVDDRVHFVDPVEPGSVVPFLASADVGLIPMQGGWLNHELTLPNKLFEYVVAGLPVVVSDLRGLGRLVRDRGLGVTFPPEDPERLADALARVLRDRDRYREAVLRPEVQAMASWRSQEKVLQDVYAEVLGAPERDAAREDVVTLATRPRRRRPAPDDHPHVVLGPRNHRAQARFLGTAISRRTGASTESMMVVRRRPDPGVDVAVTRATYLEDAAWQARWLRRLTAVATHALVEDGLPLAGPTHRPDGVEQAMVLADAGVRLAFWVTDGLSGGVAERLEKWRHELDVPVLVAHTALVREVPGAVWLPPVVDVPDGDRPTWAGDRPLVVGAARVTPEIGEALAALVASGRVTYRPQAARDVDLLIDDAHAPGPTVAALAAMARGAVVLRPSSPAPAGLPTPPVLPLDGDVRDAVESVLAEPDAAVRAARAGRRYVAEVHDGRWSVAALAGFLGAGEPGGEVRGPALHWAAVSTAGPSGTGGPPDGGDE